MLRNLPRIPILVAAVALCLAACDSSTPPAASAPAASARPAFTGASAPPISPQIRNVVLVLADDLDWKLWREVPRLQGLQSEGTTFTNFVVTDSLCCPSRTSIFRGQYVHNHQVVSNDVKSGGGWPTFDAKGYPANCLPTWLHEAGVHTGLVGKYLNEFPGQGTPDTAVEPGWDDFVVPVSKGDDYKGYDYSLDDNGVIEPHAHEPSDFLNDVLDAKASDFIAHATDRFFFELATFTPHLPSPVAPSHAGSHPGAQAPRDPSFGAQVRNGPAWLANLRPISTRMAAGLDATWQRRVESAESVADSVDTVKAALAASGHTDDTLILVTSDNGFHVGSYRLHAGKRTAFDTDTVVPMVAIGPGIAPGGTVSRMVSETDLAPTISGLMGATTPRWIDGRDFWPLVAPEQAAASDPAASARWRTAVLSESLGVTTPSDPDYQRVAPPSYAALRSERWLYVEYVNGERELYDRRTDPYEVDNIASSAPAALVAALHAQLQALRTCTGASCRTADSMPE